MLGAQSSVSKERLDALYLLDKHIRQSTYLLLLSFGFVQIGPFTKFSNQKAHFQDDWDTVSAMLESDVIPTLCSLLDGAGATECEEIVRIRLFIGFTTVQC